MNNNQNEEKRLLLKKTMYACLIISWLLCITPIPFIGILGIGLNTSALILSIICIFKDETKNGIIGLLLSTTVSPIILALGLIISTLFGVGTFLTLLQK